MPTSWPPFEVTSSAQKLQALREIVENPVDESGKKLPFEVVSWLSRLLVVRACGHLEQVVRACSRGYLERKSGGPAGAFGLSWLDRSKNPKRTSLVEHLERFNPAWATAFASFMDADDERLHRELASAVDKRNRIAHGENEGASRDQALRLCGALEEVSDWWVGHLNPH
ncbi:HEPN domain-containing protein [Curtobacterium sp. Leaf261]|uniref:HEPN domain-containing protein n=1 Tax=Curtobacterium sp. Leaf261 TaxID=1736311 RepID=UPI003FA442FC